MQKRINIRGRQYTVRGDGPDEDVEAVAADLNKRLEEVASRTRSYDEYTVALLTALNLASELHRMRHRLGDQLDSLDRDAAAVQAVIESLLPLDEAETPKQGSDDG